VRGVSGAAAVLEMRDRPEIRGAVVVVEVRPMRSGHFSVEWFRLARPETWPMP